MSRREHDTRNPLRVWKCRENFKISSHAILSLSFSLFLFSRLIRRFEKTLKHGSLGKPASLFEF